MKKKILFGAGQLGRIALSFFGADNVYCFADNYTPKQGKMFLGKDIISFDELLKMYDNDDYEIIISCMAYDRIAKQLTEAGIVSFKDFRIPVIYDYVTAVKKCLPKELINSDKLDVVVKYLYAKDILSAVKDSPNKALYARMQLVATGCNNYTFEKAKEGLEEHFKAFEKLCENMKTEGFKDDRYILMTEDNSVYDGAHRLAAAIALDKEVTVGIAGKSKPVFYDFKQFEENGFSFEDKVRILKGFADIYDECGIFVLYAPIQEQWTYMESQIKKEYKVVGSVDIDFSSNFIAFEILIREIYGDYFEDGYIADKISLLKMAPLVMRVILVSNELNKLETNDFYASITEFKLRLRDILDFELKKDSSCQIHASCNYNEYTHLKNILLSVNNLKSIEGRISPVYRREFLEQISFVRDYCKNNDIPIENICIIGSSSMDVYGINKSRDVDFIVTSELCQKILSETDPDELLKFEWINGVLKILRTDEESDKTYKESVSIVLGDVLHMSLGDNILSRDLIINNESYHFWFYGCKFINLELLISKYMQRSSYNNKDKEYLRKIQLYYDYIKSFDNKKLLKEQIEAELKKRARREF